MKEYKVDLISRYRIFKKIKKNENRVSYPNFWVFFGFGYETQTQNTNTTFLRVNVCPL